MALADAGDQGRLPSMRFSGLLHTVASANALHHAATFRDRQESA
jgi:hypothetical protein